MAMPKGRNSNKKMPEAPKSFKRPTGSTKASMSKSRGKLDKPMNAQQASTGVKAFNC